MTSRVPTVPVVQVSVPSVRSKAGEMLAMLEGTDCTQA